MSIESIIYKLEWKWQDFKWWIKDICNIPKATYLCIKYPFLYPRNVWTGNHYDNWKIYNYLYGTQDKKGIFDKAFTWVKDPNGEYDFQTVRRTTSVLWTIWFYVVKFFYEYILGFIHCLPTYTWWDSCPSGWDKAFGKQYLDELKDQLKKEQRLYSFRITTVKEKFDCLRLYCNSASKEVYNIITKYENLSKEYCIKCGKPATKITGGYFLSYCDNCYPKDHLLYQIKVNGEWVETIEYKEFLDAQNN